ncbi:hypothetical protein GBA52_017105 [Prunus armeniaca]|nr:hypothetical protein GBA52_017105 [Prunus armeniaca]
MRICEVEGDATMVVCVKSACGYSGALDHGRWVHTHLSVKYTLIDMYSKLKDDHNRVPYTLLKTLLASYYY